ncbi:hypothetical protein DPMN_163257, partial [Dreissena polymorpha]
FLPLCITSDDCFKSICADGFRTECVDRICTCSDQYDCYFHADCHDTVNLKCPQAWHCMDNRCHCY